ncbi:MAG: hypothetical protein EKK61_04195 [Rickettsiales bacterium]|nr:MAG: hypothetical protein EKK61_04195 [Rickettsiales bacterium]
MAKKTPEVVTTETVETNDVVETTETPEVVTKPKKVAGGKEVTFLRNTIDGKIGETVSLDKETAESYITS